jgi:hypothetical protein
MIVGISTLAWINSPRLFDPHVRWNPKSVTGHAITLSSIIFLFEIPILDALDPLGRRSLGDTLEPLGQTRSFGDVGADLGYSGETHMTTLALGGSNAGDQELKPGQVPLPRVSQVDLQVFPVRHGFAKQISERGCLVERCRTLDDDCL